VQKGDLIEINNGVFIEVVKPEDHKIEDIVIPVIGSET
jgi:hypothetical protein